jgi:hypothetical protein
MAFGDSSSAQWPFGGRVFSWRLADLLRGVRRTLGDLATALLGLERALGDNTAGVP